jgi:hypothetical protein
VTGEASPHPDGSGVRIMNLKDGTVTPLTTEYDNFAIWSPRGDQIALVRASTAILSCSPSGRTAPTCPG